MNEYIIRYADHSQMSVFAKRMDATNGYTFYRDFPGPKRGETHERAISWVPKIHVLAVDVEYADE